MRKTNSHKIIDLSNSKLVHLLQLFRPKKFKELDYWLQAPWTKQNKYFLPFFRLLQQAAPNFAPKKLIKSALFQQLYGDKKYNNGIFNNLISDFTKEVENFLAQQQLRKQESLKQYLVAKELLSKKESELYEGYLQKLIQSLEQPANKSTENYLWLHRLNQEIYYQSSGHHRYKSDTPTLAKADQHLDAYYLLEKLKHAHELQTRQRILKEAPLPIENDVSALWNHLQNNLNLPTANLFSFRLNELSQPNWTAYLQFKQLYLTAFPTLHFSFQQLFLFCCINDAAALYANGHPQSIQEVNEWYQFGFRHQLLLQNDGISEVTYNNVILVASHINTPKFISDFIATYKNKLPKSIKKEAHHWAVAQLAYVLGDYQLTLQELNTALPTNNLFAIQARITLLKAYFQLVLLDASYQNLFHSYCLAFERYIRRNTLYSADRSRAYLKYIQYAKRICQKYYQPNKMDKWTTLLQEIEEEPILFGKDWLKNEIMQL